MIDAEHCYRCGEEFDKGRDNPQFGTEVYKELFERVCRWCFHGEVCEDCDYEVPNGLVWGLGEENALLCNGCWDRRLGSDV